MSNAMRLGKRSLAGVAAGALALGMLSIAGATSSSAAPSAKPKVTPGTSSASIGPVRYSLTSTTQDAVESAPLLLAIDTADDSLINQDDSITFNLLSYPSTAAQVWLAEGPITIPTGAGSADDTLSATDATTAVALSAGGWFTQDLDDSIIATSIGVDAGGTYAGTITISRGGVDIQEATWSIVTAGKPTAIAVTPASLSLTASTAEASRGASVVSVTDASGNATQIASSDTLAVASSATTVALTRAAPTGSTALSSLAAGSFDDSTATTLGTAVVFVQPTATAGSATVSVTPLGTLPSTGVTAKSIAVTTTGGGTTAPTSLTLTAPTANVVDDSPANGDDTNGYTLNSNVVLAATVTGAGATPSATQQVKVTWTGSPAGVTVAGTTVASSGTTVIASADASGNVSIPMAWTTAPTQFVVTTGNGTAAQKAVVIDFIAGAFTATSTPSGNLVQKIGEATSFEVTIQDQFGNAATGYIVTGKAGSGASSAAGVTDSSGKATISVPAPSATYTGAASVVFTVLNSAGGSSGLSVTNVTMTYTATGEITSMSVAVNDDSATALTSPTAATVTKIAAAVVPDVEGTISSTTSQASYTLPTSTAAGALNVGGAHQLATFAITPVPANASTVTVPEGLYVSATKPSAIAGSQTATIASGGTAYVWGTKTGTHDVTITSGGQTITAKVLIFNTNMDAYNISLTPAKQDVATGAIRTATLSVTDQWGNGVEAASADDTGGVKVTATGEVLLAGFATSNTFATDEDGKATITFIAGNTPGVGLLTATPAGGASTKTPAWKATYTVPTGWTAPVTSSAAEVAVTVPVTKSISIVGSRTTVSGKPGISIVGVTQGFEDGKTVLPYFRFPGQTTYTEGSARPEITDGEFVWQRKTGKKFYAYVTSDDGVVKSNRVIIQAS